MLEILKMALGSDSFFAPIRFGSTDQDKEILFPDSNHSLWSHLTFLTPPVSPSTLCASENSKETNVLPCCASPLGSLKHLSEEDLDEEPCHFSRQSSGSARCQSPAILNDIMWSGYRAKRPDSAMDVDMSFSLASTPVPFFDQCLTSTVITEDLFLFSADEQRLQGEKDKSGNKGFVLTMGTFYDAFVSDSGRFLLFSCWFHDFYHMNTTSSFCVIKLEGQKYVFDLQSTRSNSFQQQKSTDKLLNFC